jgi:chaperonin GroES
MPATKTTAATKTRFRPLHDRVLVKRMEEEETRYGDIIIPDTAKGKPQQGQVIAVGSGKRTRRGRRSRSTSSRGTKCSSGSTPGARSGSTTKSI